MRKNVFFTLAAAAVMGLTFTACSDDDGIAQGGDNQEARYAITLDMPLNLDSPSLTSASATLTNVATNQTYTTANFRQNGEQYADTLTLPVGTYNIEVTGEISYALDDTTTVSATVRTASENLVVSANGATGTTLALNTYRAQDGLVISEIFYPATSTEAGKAYLYDQYLKIANNSDSILYLDGLALVESQFTSSNQYEYTPDIMSKAITVDAVYVFPGSGRENALAPGEEVLVALNAKNHKDMSSTAIDLSNADFEFYDESSIPSQTDDDNPDVPNLDKWYCYTRTIFMLNSQGTKSYALVRPTVDAETFLTDYKYTYKYTATLPNGQREMSSTAYKMPNEWVIDAVCLSKAGGWVWNVFDASLDAGYAFCGTAENAKDSYNHAVVRKKENGKWVDTNNSTNDFTSNATPSLLSAE